MELTKSIVIEAPPATVWSVLTDLDRWAEWTASVTSVRRLDAGPFGVGSRARIEQPKLRPAIWVVIEFDRGLGFTWLTRSPGVVVTGRHRIEPRGAGCQVTLSIRFGGLLGPVVGWMARGLTSQYLGLEAEGLKRRCEAPAATA